MSDLDKSGRTSGPSEAADGITDEELIMELDNMLEEDGAEKSESKITDEEALDMGLDQSEETIASVGDDDVLDLEDSMKPESIGLEHKDLELSDEVLDLGEDEIVEELSDADLIEDDELLELEDLVSDESLQYDPMLSKSKTDDLYIEDGSDLSADVVFDESDLAHDYDDSFGDEMGLEITSDVDLSDEGLRYIDSSVAAGVSVEQIEAAVERVVTRLFTDRIESLLSEVIERVVREELSNLKKSLTEE